jgi:hypothetical protein
MVTSVVFIGRGITAEFNRGKGMVNRQGDPCPD